jgi:hypothetical protein
MPNRPAVAIVLLALCAPGCARRSTVARASARWILVEPPQVEDPTAPRGVRILPDARLAEWGEQGSFASEEECVTAKRADINRTIDHARAATGEAEAKYDPAVRRAVHARCVLATDMHPSAPGN